MKARLETFDLAQLQGQKIEEQGTVHLGGQRHQLAFGFGSQLFVNVLDVGRLTTQSWTVINDLAVDLAR